MFDSAASPEPTAFLPAPGLRSAFVQSMLASKRPVRWLWRQRGLDLNARSTLLTLNTADEQGAPVQLTGWHTPHADPKSLVVLIHGWEGSHDSSYLYGLACTLYRAGHSIFRLNLRDHGSTHHGLNEGMFHSARLAEVLGAIQQIQQLDDSGTSLQVVGFSLGGNFALRVGLHGPAADIHPTLCIGISPALNPGSTLIAIDNGPQLINRYFLDKWHKTMDAKARAFPGRYDFSQHKNLRNFTEITRAFVATHTPFPDLDAYLGQYTLRPGQLMASPTPLAILTAEDDSVCPPADFEGLSLSGNLRHYLATARGGHCGFIRNWKLESWADDVVTDWIARSH
ncbi:MAG: alpha/beta fold hydrolase [Stagnimonas sp.]|nr:alpha/beta fold hydrolase [Stagnimonas sp.]